MTTTTYFAQKQQQQQQQEERRGEAAVVTHCFVHLHSYVTDGLPVASSVAELTGQAVDALSGLLTSLVP